MRQKSEFEQTSVIGEELKAQVEMMKLKMSENDANAIQFQSEKVNCRNLHKVFEHEIF